jgi:putative endonuclease
MTICTIFCDEPCDACYSLTPLLLSCLTRRPSPCHAGRSIVSRSEAMRSRSIPTPVKKRRSYYTYIMGSLSGTLYVGVTGNLHTRIFEHKSHKREGFTSRYEVVRLLYWESYDDVHKAIGREKQLKGWRRDRKIALVQSTNPHWIDLAKDWHPWMESA